MDSSVYSRAERVFILEHYFESKSFVAVREAFSNAYRDKDSRKRNYNKPTGNKFVFWWDDAELYQNLLTRFISLLEEN
jgi:hypothetical protein